MVKNDFRIEFSFSDHCAQARRKQEDNLAVVFLGIVLVFLICHTPRNICNLAETYYIDNSIECQKMRQNGFPFWVLVLNTIRFVIFLSMLSLPTISHCFFPNFYFQIKFIYSKAKKFCKIFTLLLTGTT